jgi:hypothetical protein
MRSQTNSTEPLLSVLAFPIETPEALVTKTPPWSRGQVKSRIFKLLDLPIR